MTVDTPNAPYTTEEYKRVLSMALTMMEEPALQKIVVEKLNEGMGLDKLAWSYFWSNSRSAQ